MTLTGAASLLVASARGQEAQEFPLQDDDGGPISNFRIPSELDPATLPGILWQGANSGDVVLYEFFDYNCGYCHEAAHDLVKLVARDKNLRLGLVNNAILSIGSVQAAKVQQAVLRLHGPRVAGEFHAKMFERRGQSDGTTALAVAREMGLDADKIEQSGDSPSVSEALKRQAKLARALGMGATPSFAIAGVGLLGWPGGASLRKMIASARKCDHPICSG